MDNPYGGEKLGKNETFDRVCGRRLTPDISLVDAAFNVSVGGFESNSQTSFTHPIPKATWVENAESA